MKTYLIWSHQKNAWWRPGGRGYTTNLLEAGRFTEAEAAGQLRWHEHREFLADGRPHEVLVETLTPEQMRDVLGPLILRDRINQATTEAVVVRAGLQVKP